MTHIPLVCSQYRKRDPDFPFQLAVHRLDKHFPAHRHDFMEFSLVLEGSGTEVIDGVEHRMDCGTFTFVMPYQVHEIFVNPDAGKPLKLFNCNFGMELFWGMHDNFWINRFLLQADQRLPSQIQLEGGHYDRVLATLKEMHEEYTGESLWRRELLFSGLIDVLVRFDRLRRQAWGTYPSKDRSTASRSHFGEIMHYVQTNYRTDLNLTSLAAHFHLSVSYLSELFKKRIGQNFVDYLHHVRIRHACVLLKSTKMTVSEIAFEVGYGSFSTFSRVFREMKGVTPTDYRKAESDPYFGDAG